MSQTVMRASTNYFAHDQDVSFAERVSLPDAMRTGCRAAIRAQTGDDPFLVNLGFDEPVTVTQNSAIEGLVETAIGLIVYSDAEFDSIFYVYRSRDRDVGLAAVMGSSFDISRCFDGYLESDRYLELSWDAGTKTRRDMFALPDFWTLYADAGSEGAISGALVEGRMVSVGKMDVEEVEFDRVPPIALGTASVIAHVYRSDELTLPAELFGAFEPTDFADAV